MAVLQANDTRLILIILIINTLLYEKTVLDKTTSIFHMFFNIDPSTNKLH